ncbi:MAG: hypothetical protein LBU79_08095 [Planctomycetota bacterium]|jgi:spore maturation protein SpmB|nr:hypothetical protein [Planctomycetota bacterium]
MFVRIKKVKQYEYFQIVEGRREGGKVKQDVILNLGRVDLLQSSGIADLLLEGLTRITGKTARDGDGKKTPDPTDPDLSGLPRP